MYKFYLGILSLIVLPLLAGCNADRQRLFPFGWSATGQLSDSILMLMDRNVMSYGDPAELSRLVDEYCRLSAAEDPLNIYNHRRLYWRGTALFMNGDFERGDSLRREAITQCDSVRFPRDIMMYRMAIEQPSDFVDNLARYDRYSSDLNLFLKYDDPVSAFTRAVQLSNLIAEAGMHDTAMRYALLADSLLQEAELPILRANNRVNIAACRFASGDTVGAVTTLKELKASGAPSAIPSMAAIINFNLHQMSGDTVALREAWEAVRDDVSLTRMKPLVAAAMVKEGMFPHGDEAADETRKILSLADYYAYLPEEEMYIAEAGCELALQANDPRQIAKTMKSYLKAVDNYRSESKRNELISAETSRLIRNAEHKAEINRIQHQRFIIITISVIILGLVVLSFLIFRYVSRLRRLRLLQQLDSERLRRSKLSLELSLTEKEILISSLQSKINEMVRTDGLPEQTAIALEHTLAEERNLSTSEKDAEFIRKFIVRFPKVGKTGRRLALYISRGMETSEIAAAMNIRKESVIQSRWRLRNRMQLSPEEDLDIVIQSLLIDPYYIDNQ